MARIPFSDRTSPAPRGVIQSRANPGSFGVDITPVGEGLGQLAQLRDKARREKASLDNASKLARGRQEWLLYTQDMMGQVERGEQSYQGMTNRFQNDYATWAASMNDTVDDDMRQEFDTNLLEMENGFLGQIKSFEIAKNAESVQKTYNEMTNSVIGPIISARTQEEADMAMSNITPVVRDLPPTIQQNIFKSANRTYVENISNQRAVAGDTDFTDLKNVTEGMRGDLTPSEYASQLELIERAMNTATNTRVNKIERSLTAAGKLAEIGVAPMEAIENIKIDLDDLDQQGLLPVEISQNIRLSVDNLKSINDTANQIYSLPTSTLNQMVLTQQADATQEPDPTKRLEKIAMSQQTSKMITDRNKVLTENFAETMRARNPNIKSHYDEYVRYIQDFEQTENPSSNELAKLSFDAYRREVDREAERIQSPTRTYFTNSEVEAFSRSINEAFTQEDGVNQVIGLMSQSRDRYGSAFPDLMAQLSAKDKSLRPIGMVPMLQNRPNEQRALIESFQKAKIDPDNFKVGVADFNDVATTNNAIIEDMRLQGMDADVAARIQATALLYKYAELTGQDIDRNALFDDIQIRNGMIIPQGFEPRDIEARLFHMTNKLDRSLIAPPPGDLSGVDNMSYGDIVNDIFRQPFEYLNDPLGDGYILKWPGTMQPVLRKDGSRIKFTFDELQTVVLPEKSFWSFSTLSGKDSFGKPLE
jgi:hypothetical protein